MNSETSAFVPTGVTLEASILVTGSNGFIGVKVVEALLDRGFRNLRCFARPSSRLENLTKLLVRFGLEARELIVLGDLGSPDDCRRAAEGVEIVFHLAAGFDKSFAGAFMNSVLTTRNLLDAFAAVGRPRRFVNVSSFAVYSNLSIKRGGMLDEASPLEDAPQCRYDAYGFGKLKQEEIVRQFGLTQNIPFVILRPGTVFGPGKRDLTGRIGINTFGFFIHIGGSNQLPLTFVDNCAEAIVLAGFRPGVNGEVFNVVDDELMTSREFLRAYRKRVGRFFALPIPYPIAYLLCIFWEEYATRSKQLPPVFNRRRCSAEWKGNRFPNAKIRDRLGWKPRVPLKQAMESFLSQFDAS
jgi:nucleoside-diphosphate-sugar epimerase